MARNIFTKMLFIGMLFLFIRIAQPYVSHDSASNRIHTDDLKSWRNL